MSPPVPTSFSLQLSVRLFELAGNSTSFSLCLLCFCINFYLLAPQTHAFPFLLPVWPAVHAWSSALLRACPGYQNQQPLSPACACLYPRCRFLPHTDDNLTDLVVLKRLHATSPIQLVASALESLCWRSLASELVNPLAGMACRPYAAVHAVSYLLC